MKLDEANIVDVQICTENDDVLLTTAKGQVHPPRAGRAGLQGPGLDGRARHQPRGRDSIISMAILRHVEATGEERAGYLRCAAPHGRAAERRDAPEGEEEPLPPSRCRPSATRKWAPRSSSS